MDDLILDLDNLTILLTSVLQQLDRSTLEQVTVVLDNRIIEEMLLEVIGVARQRLSLEEQARFSEIIQSVLNKARA